MTYKLTKRLTSKHFKQHVTTASPKTKKASLESFESIFHFNSMKSSLCSGNDRPKERTAYNKNKQHKKKFLE